MEIQEGLSWDLPAVDPSIYSAIVSAIIEIIATELERRYMVLDEIEIDLPFIILTVKTRDDQYFQLNIGNLVDFVIDYADFESEVLTIENGKIQLDLEKLGIDLNLVLQRFLVMLDLLDTEQLNQEIENGEIPTIADLRTRITEIAEYYGYSIDPEKFRFTIETEDGEVIESNWFDREATPEFLERYRLRRDRWTKALKTIEDMIEEKGEVD